MSAKTLKKAIRKNKSKEEIISDIKQSEKVAHIKETVKNIFPTLEQVDSIYDAQTVVNALSGFISAHIEKKLGDIKMSDIEIDLSKEEDSKIKTSMLELIEMLKDEPAKDLSQTLERLGKTLSEYGAYQFLKKPMTEIKITDIVKD